MSLVSFLSFPKHYNLAQTRTNFDIGFVIYRLFLRQIL